MTKFLAILLLILGEGLAIYAEMLLARRWGGENSILVPVLILVTVAGFCLVFGYATSYSAFRNIWIVTAISVGSIFILEPILSWLMFHEMPTHGALIGLVFGALGFLSTLFIQ